MTPSRHNPAPFLALLLTLAAALPAFAQSTAPAVAILHPDKIDEYLVILQVPEPLGPAPQITSYKVAAAQIIAEKFWSDPRAEKALAAYATPPYMGHELQTPRGEVRDQLAKLRAKLQYAAVMRDAPTADERLPRARKFLAVPIKDPHDKNFSEEEFIDAHAARDYFIVQTLNDSGAAAVDIALDYPWHMEILAKGYTEKFASELADEAKRRGPAFMIQHESRIWRMPYDKDGKWVALLQLWLSEAKNDDDRKPLTAQLCQGPGGRERCVALLLDPRPIVALTAALKIEGQYRDAESAAALKAAIARQTTLGMDAATLARMQVALERAQFEGHLLNREELDTLYTTDTPNVMTRINAMRELATRFPDQRTLDLVKKVRAGIPESLKNSWLAKYSDSEITQLEKTLEAPATQPAKPPT